MLCCVWMMPSLLQCHRRSDTNSMSRVAKPNPPNSQCLCLSVTSLNIASGTLYELCRFLISLGIYLGSRLSPSASISMNKSSEVLSYNSYLLATFLVVDVPVCSLLIHVTLQLKMILFVFKLTNLHTFSV